MRKYWAAFSNAWAEYMTLRLNLLLETCGGVIFLFATILFWRATYRLNGLTRIGGYSEKEMMTYLVISSLLFILLWWTAQGDEIANEIHDGRLSHLIIKPFFVPGYYFMRDIPRKIHTLLLGCGLVGMLGIYFRSELIIPHAFYTWLIFFAAVVIAICLHFLLFILVAFLAFWFEEVWGFGFVFRVVIEVLGGAIIPISLFPHVVSRIVIWLPFPFLFWVPSGLFLGKFDAHETLQLFLVGVGWIFVLLSLMLILWRYGLRRYTGAGGV